MVNVRTPNRGFTLIETVVVLAIIATLVAILTPYVTAYVEQARIARALADVKTIGEAIARFEKDVGRYPMFTNAAAGTSDGMANVIRLYGPGTVLSDTSGNTSQWIASGSAGTDCVATSPPCTTDTFDNQLVINAPNYPTSTSAAKPFKWKGPYITVTEDPWGHQYLVNIVEAKSSSNKACFMLSAGPDGIIQTPYLNDAKSNFAALGDDIIYRIK
jgi:prepilin-type N-terminal cleavage/methylation domain-containing protein